ncbi:RICIN domain-containing protein [Kribbella sp. DT2]|uniref:RICIN domain-containing protein n=1 Tax=Kribbella sp. DT2 TaxID=3393427 RepID=UPI003CF1EA26
MTAPQATAAPGATTGEVARQSSAAGQEVHSSGSEGVVQVTKRALIRNQQTQRCLASNAAGSPYTTPCNSASTYQQWRFEISSNQRIWNVATGRCLTYALASGSATGAVSTASCNGSSAQVWLPHTTGALWTYIGGRCLDSNSQGTVYTLSCNGSGNQIWQKIYFSTP